MKKKGQYASVTIGDISGVTALLVVAVCFVVMQMQFRGWERVTNVLDADIQTTREGVISGVKSEMRMFEQGQLGNYDFIVSLRDVDAYHKIVIDAHEKAINHNADLYEQLLHGVREHVKSIHYGRPTREEQAKRRVRKALR